MLLRVETYGNAAIHTLVDRTLQRYDLILLLLQQSQSGAHDLAGIVITPLCNRGLDEVLEICSQSYQYLVIQQIFGRFYCLFPCELFARSFFMLRKLLKLRSMNRNTSDSR